MTRSEFRANNKKNGEKKRSVLDRSLKGMIEDDQQEESSNGYFRSK